MKSKINIGPFYQGYLQSPDKKLKNQYVIFHYDVALASQFMFLKVKQIYGILKP